MSRILYPIRIGPVRLACRPVFPTPATCTPYGVLARLASTSSAPTVSPTPSSHPTRTESSALAKLPLTNVLRSYLIMGVSSSPLLLNTTTMLLRGMLRAKSSLFDVDRNPLLRYVFRKTFYDQFCAGPTERDIQRTVKELQDVGFNGIILEYALEVVEDENNPVQTVGDELKTINAWKDGLVTTVNMANNGDFVGLKWSGMGLSALNLLKEGQPPSHAMLTAMRAVCDAAAAKGVKLLPAAEPQYAQASVDRWTTSLASEYNKKTPGYAVLYNTYQCYLKSTPATLASHLVEAAAGGYTLGIKLVRGAYLDTERRSLIWDTIEQTHAAYDAVVHQLLLKQYGKGLPAPEGAAVFPRINLMLATHNQESVSKARALRDSQPESVRAGLPLAYAQLQGMADEVSMKLLCVEDGANRHTAAILPERPRVYKCVTWGTTKQCLNYLMRRASENSEAMSRTIETRRAMGAELRRRLFGVAWP